MSSTKGLSWALGVKVADEGSRPLLAFGRNATRVAQEVTKSAKASASALDAEAKAAREAAADKTAAAESAAAAAKRAAADEVAAAQRAATERTTAARKAAVAAKQVSTAQARAAQLAQREATAADSAAARKERAARQAAAAVTKAARDEMQAHRDLEQSIEDLARKQEQASGRGAGMFGDRFKTGMAAAGVAGGAALTAGFSRNLELGAGRAQLKAQLGLTERDARRAGNSAGRLYADAYGESMGDINAAIAAVGSNIESVSKLSARELDSFAGKTLNLQQVFGADAAELTRTVGQLVRSRMAKDVVEAFNIITFGFQRGANKSDEFLDTLNEYSEPLKSLGVDAQTFTSMLVAGAENGVYSIDKIGDAYKEFSIRAVDTSTATQDAYKVMGLDANAYRRELLKGGESAKQATSEIISALGNISGPIKREEAGVALFGSMWEDLGEQAVLGLDPAKVAIEDVGGAARKLGDDLAGPDAAKITKFRRGLEQDIERVLANDVIPALEDAGEAVSEFAGEHPNIVKAAGALMGVSIAVKGIRFAGAITGVTDLLRGVRKLTPWGRRAGGALGDELGDELGRTASRRARGELRKNGALTGGLAGRMKSVGVALGSWLGLPLGTTAADKAGDGLRKNGAITGRVGGRMSSIGSVLGKALGVSMAVAAADELSNWIDNFKSGGDPVRKEQISRAEDPLDTRSGLLKFLPDSIRDKLPFRRGGVATAAAMLSMGVPAFASGGMVPAVVSPGELIEYGGYSGIVPGARVAADTVPMLLPVGARVYTDHGQSLLSMGVPADQALAHQLPHFREGGSVKKQGGFLSTSYGPPWGGIQGQGITKTGVDLRSGPKRYLVAVDPTVIPLHSRLGIWPNPFGYRGDFRAEDTGGAIRGKRIDFYDWRGRSQQMAWGRREVTVGTSSTGSAARSSTDDDGSKTVRYTVARSVGRSPTRGGLLEDPYSTAFGAVETYGSRAAARRSGALFAPIRSALDELKDSYTRTIERTIPGSKGRSSSSSKGAKPSGGWARPVSGPITSRFGMRSGRMHKGIDFGVGIGTAVRSVRGGTVALGMNDPGGWGMNARVEHENGLSSLYAHLSSITARPGDRVSAGDVIARSGNSGRSTGPHLHLETWRNGAAFDPSSVIKLRRGGLVGARRVAVAPRARRGGGGAQHLRTGGQVRQSAAVTSALADVRRSTSDEHLRALSEAVSTATLRQIQVLRRDLLARIRTGGDAAANARLRAALTVLDVDLAGRVQERVQRLGILVSGWDAKTANSSHWMRRSGVDEGSSTGLQIGITNAQTYLGAQSGSELRNANSAIAGARRLVRDATSTEGREAARAKLAEAQQSKDEILERRTEARSSIAELTRALPQALAAERVGRLDLNEAMAALSGRDPSTDPGLLAARQQEFARQLAEAQANGNAAWATDAANSLRGIQDAIREIPKVEAAARVQELDYRMGYAQLTESVEDDRQVLADRERQTLADLATAESLGDKAWAIELLGTLRATRDALEQLDTSQQERDARDQELIDLLKQTRENQQKLLAGSAISRDVIGQAIGAAAAGYIGQSVTRSTGAGGFAPGGWRP